MKNIIKSLVIALVAVVGLSVSEIGCGASEDGATDELGSAQEALTMPSGYGYVASTGSACPPSPGGTTCIFANDKTLKTNLVQLGTCAGSMWQNGFNAATTAFNTDASGTGFHTATTVGNETLTPKCVAAGFGGAFFRLTPTTLGSPFFLTATGNTYQSLVAANLELAGNDIVAHCQAAHINCQDFIRDQFRSLLNQAAGNRKAELTLTSSDKSHMTAYAP